MSFSKPGECPADAVYTPSRPHHLSCLTHIYWNHGLGQYRLDQARVTEYPQFDNFAALRWYVLGPVRYPRPQGNKFETYSWVPTLYMPSVNVARRHTEEACWRCAANEADTLSCYVADIDNKDDTRLHVTEADVAARLASLVGQPVQHFTYTTYSSSPERRKFRGAAETTRDVTRVEQRDISVLLNESVFGGQADVSIYDPGDHVYGPPHHTETTVTQGVPLPVDALLAMALKLRTKRPELWAAFEKKGSPATRGPTPEELVMRGGIGDWSARPEFTGIGDPLVFNPDWLNDIDTATRHYDTMLSVLGKVWRKNGGDLSRGEMQQVWDDIDSRWGAYMRRSYDRNKADEMIGFIMRQTVIDAPEPVKSRRALAKALRALKRK